MATNGMHNLATLIKR
ncbi:unnamed protein product, partial [Parascedosporium putredinis]